MSDRADIEEDGRLLVERLGGRWGANGGLCRCPAHDDRTPSLSIRVGRTRLLFHCFAGCDPADVLRALQARGVLTPKAGERRSGPAVRGADRLGGAARRIWSEARPIAGTPARDYLAGRGLRSDSGELRYHPRTPHGSFPMTQYRPAMIAAVRDESGVVAIHRTFIDPAARCLAPLEQPKCGLGRFGCGAVRLGGSGPVVGLAEGVETALSAAALFGHPCWATLGTERFRLVALPSGVERLLLFLDRDSGGRRAEALARAAFADSVGIEVHYAPRPGEDWNDELRRRLGGRGEEAAGG